MQDERVAPLYGTRGRVVITRGGGYLYQFEAARFKKRATTACARRGIAHERQPECISFLISFLTCQLVTAGIASGDVRGGIRVCRSSVPGHGDTQKQCTSKAVHICSARVQPHHLSEGPARPQRISTSSHPQGQPPAPREVEVLEEALTVPHVHELPHVHDEPADGMVNGKRSTRHMRQGLTLKRRDMYKAE